MTSQASLSDASAPPPRRSGCGCWTISLGTIAAAFVFVLGVYGLWRWSNARALERMIGIAKEKGEPTTWEELAATQPTSPEIERTTQLWVEAADKATWPHSANDVMDVAIVGSMGQEGSASRRAMESYMQTGVMPPRIRDASKAYLTKTGDVVELAHSARRSGTLARFPLATLVGEETYRESIQKRRHLANVLCLDLEVRRAEGATEGLGENLLTLLALVESDRESPDRSRQLVRYALLSIAREQIVASLERGELSDAELKAQQLAWEQIDLSVAVRKMAVDAQVHAFRGLPNGDPDYLEDNLRPCPEEDAYQAAKALRTILDRSKDFDSVEKALAEANAEWAKVRDGPFAEQRLEGWKNLLLSTTLVIEMLRTHQSFVDAVVVTLACERFRRDRGAWPERLDELVPDYLKELPPDRWDGGGLKYVKSEDELRIYSVGADERDDGGQIHDNYLATPADYGVRLSRPRNPNESATDE